MSETTNYGLYITDDSTETFRNWRRQMNGEANSNMTKIDAILHEKADQSISVEVVVPANGWIGEAAPFTQEITVAGLTADGNGAISLAHSASAEERRAVREAAVSVYGQAEEKLSLVADGVKPTVDLHVLVTMIY